jgi:hypothetical protein
MRNDAAAGREGLGLHVLRDRFAIALRMEFHARSRGDAAEFLNWTTQ